MQRVDSRVGKNKPVPQNLDAEARGRRKIEAVKGETESTAILHNRTGIDREGRNCEEPAPPLEEGFLVSADPVESFRDHAVLSSLTSL